MAEIREVFGISGQSVANAIQFRDKIEMKKMIAKAGLNVPKFIRAESALEVLQFIEQHGYPVIIKPVNGAGTVNVNLIRNEEQLDNFFNANTVDDLDVKAYIDGKMFAIDGLFLTVK